MSAERGEPDPQEWPTYPGGPNASQPQWSQPPPTNSKPFSDPDPAPGDQGNPSYQRQPWPPQQPNRPFPAPYQQQQPPKPDQWLRNKWIWIVGSLVAVFVILGIARGGGGFPIMPVIFGLIVWQILRHRRRP